MVELINNIFSIEKFGNTKFFIYTLLAIYVMYIFTQIYNTLRRSTVSELKITWFYVPQIIFMSIIGNRGGLCQLLIKYFFALKNTPRKLQIGLLRFHYTDNPDDIQTIFNNSNFLERGKLIRVYSKAIGQGLITARVPKWKKTRRLLSFLFTSKFVEKHLPVFDYESSRLVKNLQNYSDTNENCDLWIPVMRAAMATALRFGIGNMDIIDDVVEGFQLATDRMVELCDHQMFIIWLYPKFMFNLYGYIIGFWKDIAYVNTKTEQCLSCVKQKFKQNKEHIEKDGKDSIILSMAEEIFKQNETGAGLTAQQLSDEGKTFVSAGSETNSIVISFTLLLMAMNPEIQEKAYEEIIEVFGEDDQDLSIQQIQQMTYLEQCINETLRLFPPIPFPMRKATKTFKLNNNYTIEENSEVLLPTFVVHRNPNIYPNPLKWNPDNFAPEKVESRHKYSFFPFSGGARACIGMKYAMLSMKITLIKVLKHYRFETDTTMDDIKLKFGLTIHSINGYKVKLYTRRKSKISD